MLILASFLSHCPLSSLFYGSSLTIDVEPLFERFHSVTFQYSSLFTLSLICMLIVIHHFFHLLLACVPKSLFFRHIESILLRAPNESFHIIKNCMNKPLCSIFKQFQRTGLCFILKLWSVLLPFWEKIPKLDILVYICGYKKGDNTKSSYCGLLDYDQRRCPTNNSIRAI